MFVCGWCFHPDERIRELSFVLDGAHQRVMAQRMPRLDPFEQLHPNLDPAALTDPSSAEDPLLHSYASGFWGLVQVDLHGRETSVLEPRLHAKLDSGRCAEASLGSIRVSGRPVARGDDSAGHRHSRRAVRGHLHGDPQPADGATGAPAGFDPPPEPPQLDLRDQRRLLPAGSVPDAGGRDRWRPPLHPVAQRCAARLLRELRTRPGDGARGRRLRRAGRSGRLLVPGQTHDAARCDRLGVACLQRRAGDHRRRRGSVGDLLEPPPEQPHRSAVAAGRQLGDRSGIAPAS